MPHCSPADSRTSASAVLHCTVLYCADPLDSVLGDFILTKVYTNPTLFKSTRERR